MSDFTPEQVDAILSRSWKDHLISFSSDGSLAHPVQGLDDLFEGVSEWLRNDRKTGVYGSAGCIEAFRQALAVRYGWSPVAEAMNTQKNEAVCSIIGASGFTQAVYESIQNDSVVKLRDGTVEHLSASLDSDQTDGEALHVEYAAS